MPVDLEDRGQALENEYFRRREQELIEKMKAKLESENAAASALKCPKCDGSLVESDYEDIKIDICNKCSGVWFDAGELAHVVEKEPKEGWLGRLFS